MRTQKPAFSGRQPGTHKLGRDRDPDRLGVAVTIDLDRVLERGAVVMER